MSKESTAGAAGWLQAQQRLVRKPLLRALGAGSVSTVLLALQSGALAWSLNQVVMQRRPGSAVAPVLAVMVLLAALRWLLGWQARRCSQAAAAAVVVPMRRELMAKIQRLGPRWIAGRDSGELVTRVVDGVDSLGPYFSRYLPQVAAAGVFPLVILLAVFPADWVAGLSLLLCAPLIPLFMILLGRLAEQASQRRWQMLTRLGSQFMDLLQGLHTLRLFGATAAAQQRLVEAGEGYRRETMAVLRVAFLSSLVLEFFATVSIAVVAVLVGFRLFFGHEAFLPGMFVLLLAPEFFLPLRSMGALRHAKMDALAFADDAIALLAEPEPLTATGSLRPAPAPISLELQALAYQPEAERGGLQPISLSIAAGQRLALVGPSGAGKSTLLLLVLGLLAPSSGQVRVNGQRLDQLDPDWWRQQLSWVPQNPRLFMGTIRDNLLIARRDASPAQMQLAAQQACLLEVIEASPAGWDTVLGEHGHGLSGGELQRLALARAFLRDTPLLVLDEPLQALDEVTAQRVEQALQQQFQGRTVIQAVHRLQQARTADRVAVLQHGRLEDFGSHDQLLDGGGWYARRWPTGAANAR